jgi:hypothetical protein
MREPAIRRPREPDLTASLTASDVGLKRSRSGFVSAFRTFEQHGTFLALSDMNLILQLRAQQSLIWIMHPAKVH